MRTFPIAPLAMLVALAACGGGEGASSGPALAQPTVRDSAGIRIVESASEGLPVWTVAPEPVLSIGALNGSDAETLYQVNDVDRLASGAWLVSHGSTEEIRVFDSEGTWLRTIGRSGEGPGEFGSLASLFVLPGDSAAAWDSSQRRVSVFDPAGIMHRELTFEELPEGRVTPFGRLESGEWGVRRSGRSLETPGSARAGPSRTSELHAVAAPDGTGPAVFAEIPASPGWVVASPTFTVSRTIPFGGGNAMEAIGDRFVGGISDHPEVRIWDARGVEVERWRILEAARPVRDDAWNAARARERTVIAEMEDGFPAELAEAYADFWDEVERPGFEPYWGRVRTSEGGEVWLSEHVHLPDEPRRWRVFDASGALVREVRLPEGFELHWIGDSLVAGVVTDEFDVEYVHAYRLVPPT